MDSTQVKSVLLEKAAMVHTWLTTGVDSVSTPQALRKAMEYSLLAGGKRVRPVLCLTTASMFGLAEKDVLPFACGWEFIHTYSLVHDDLPAMDDDDLRRGKPSNHKMFGEATAILAGDGLLTDAFGCMTSVASVIDPAHVVEALVLVATAAGSAGMVGGQVLDMEYTGRNDIDLEKLRRMHAMKTGALIYASCLSGAILAGAGKDDRTRIEQYGKSIGVAFQIVDDILDEVGDEKDLGKPVGSDQDQGKVTYPSLVGIDKSRELAAGHVAQALDSIAPFRGEQADLLRGLAQYIVDRVS